jgi:hypothetical protein
MIQRFHIERVARPERAGLYPLADALAAVVEHLTTRRPAAISAKDCEVRVRALTSRLVALL